MFKITNRYLIALLCLPYASSAIADDMEIYAGQTVEVSAPVELVFAVDTSTSMACSITENLAIDDAACYNSFYVNNPPTSKAHTVRNVLSNLFANSEVLPDNVHVGLAYYNEPGGSIVRSLEALSSSTGSPSYPTHRELLVEEVSQFVPGGTTPILGTLLEIGQYLTGEQVIAGTARKSSPIVDLGQTGWNNDEFSVERNYGQIARVSHSDAMLFGSGSRSALNACDTALSSDLVTGGFDVSCIGEHWENAADSVVRYNEDINTASVCAASAEENETKVTTQIVLITDGLPSWEQMSLPMHGARMGTWVKRFVTGDPSATGYLSAAERALAGETLPEDVSFETENYGCPITANAYIGQDWEDEIDGPDSTQLGRLILSQQAFVENTIPSFSIEVDRTETMLNNPFYVNPANEGSLSSADLTIPSFDIQKAYYQSCLNNVALRFRELGVKVHVIGFGLDDGEASASGVDNALLEKIANITGGQFFPTSDADQLADFLNGISTGSVSAASVNATLAPSVSVNPGSILSNSDDVYYPMFKAGATSYLYGNLKKYKLKTELVDRDTGEVDDNDAPILNAVASTIIVDANDNEATTTCQHEGDPDLGEYVCFRETAQSFWSEEVDGAVVTKGGAAAQQKVYGKDPDGRRVFIQSGDEIDLLELIAVDGQEFGAPDSDEEENSSPDANAFIIDSANEVTKNYFAQLVPNPDDSETTFANYEDLEAHASADEIKESDAASAAYDMVRWLIGFDEKRFDSNGLFNSIAVGNESSLSERDILNLVGGDVSFAPSVPADSDLENSRLYYGSIVHSQPTVVNYSFREVGNEGSLEYDNVIFVSGNDGFLRVIDAESGEEEASFFPESLIENIPAMYEMREGALSYGLDSTWTSWRQDLPVAEVVNGQEVQVFDGKIEGKTGFEADSGGFVRIYGGMRRGGRSYYFFDMTDRDTPRLLKELKGGEDEFVRMGQTWSQPTLAKVKVGGKVTAVTVFGGGFDLDYDVEIGQAEGPCADSPAVDGQPEVTVTCGNQIYVVNAGSLYDPEDNIGDVIWWASNTGVASSSYARVEDMKHSIPAQIKVLDKDGDGLADRLYFGDLGGQVFRVNIDNSGDDSVFSVVTLAQLGNEGLVPQTEEDNRVFFETPSVALMNNGNDRYVGVSLVSGWRENPKERVVNDEMYFIRDNLDDQADWTLLRRPVSDGESGSDGFVTILNDDTTLAQFNSAKAFSVALDLEGEKAFGSPIILFGNVFWPTYIPPTNDEVTESENTCTPAPQRSRVSFIRTQSNSPEVVLNSDGTIEKVNASTDLPTLYHTTPELSVPLSGLGVHLSNDAVSILAGTKAISLTVEKESVKKTRWELLENGSDAIPDNPVTRD